MEVCTGEVSDVDFEIHMLWFNQSIHYSNYPYQAINIFHTSIHSGIYFCQLIYIESKVFKTLTQLDDEANKMLNIHCWLYYAKYPFQSAESKWKVVCPDQNCFCSRLIYSKLVRKTLIFIPNKIYFLCRRHSSSNTWLCFTSLQTSSSANEKVLNSCIVLWTGLFYSFPLTPLVVGS